MEITARELAKTYARAAKQNYERDGHLMPVLHVVDAKGAGFTMVPNPERFGGQPREQFAALIALTADAIETTYIGTCVEAWMKAFPAQKGVPDLERGQLSREADKDPEIRTSIVVHVIDVRDASNTYSVMMTVKGDPRDHEYDEHEQNGVMEGGLMEALIQGYNAACLQIIPLPEGARDSVAHRMQFLGSVDFIAAALYTEEIDRDG